MTLQRPLDELSRQAPYEREIQLLVEGNDERNFFESLIEHLSFENMEVRNFRGKDNLRDFLLALRDDDDFAKTVQGVGIVRDADNSAEAAFESIRNSLRHAGLPAPTLPQSFARPDGGPAVGVFVMPGGGRAGMLETILRDTFANSEIERCIEAYLECVRGLPGVVLQRPDKARVHAWLATRPDPHVSAGVAAKKGYWDMDHPALKGVREFLLALRDGAGGP